MADTAKDRPTYTTEYVKGDWDQAYYLDNPHTDNIMTALLGLGAEVWAIRRRNMVLEKFLAQNGTIDPAAIEAYVPTAEERAAWEKERDDFIDRVFAVLTRPTIKIPTEVPTARTPPRPA